MKQAAIDELNDIIAKTASIGGLARVARGPFSYCVGPERFTVTGCGVTFCASTYRTMMRHGWVTEVL